MEVLYIGVYMEVLYIGVYIKSVFHSLLRYVYGDQHILHPFIIWTSIGRAST